MVTSRLLLLLVSNGCIGDTGVRRLLHYLIGTPLVRGEGGGARGNNEGIHPRNGRSQSCARARENEGHMGSAREREESELEKRERWAQPMISGDGATMHGSTCDRRGTQDRGRCGISRRIAT